MKKTLQIIGYLGMVIFIVASILDSMVNLNCMLSAILIIASLIMFLPMLIEEIKSIMKFYK